MSKSLKLSVGLLSAVLFAAEGPWVGTWKLDSAKSTKSAAPKASKESTITIRELGDRIIEVAFKGTRNDGTPVSGKYTVSLDGGPNTYLEGGPPAGVSATTKKIDERNSVITTTRDGREIGVNHVALGEDGKTFTANMKGLDGEGKPFNVVEVYGKQ